MNTQRLRQIPLFSGLDGTILDQYSAGNLIFAGKYAKGATVHHQRDGCTSLDVVLSGSLVAYALSENGSAVNVFEFTKNGIIGANLLFGEDGAYPLNIYCVSDCELLHVTKDAVEALLFSHEFTMRYIRSLSANSQGMNRRIAMLTQRTLRENILDYLKRESARQGTREIVLPISKKQLADSLGVQRPSLFRELKNMKDEGILRVQNRSIRLLR